MESQPVIDCQSHWHPRAYFEHLAARSGYPRARRDAAGDYVVEMSDASSFPIAPLLLNLDQQLADARAAGIDVLVSSTGSFGVEDLPLAEAREIAMMLNEASAEAERAHGGRFVGLARLPMQDAGAALDLLADAVDRLGLRGVCICSNIAGASIATPALEPVYADLERRRLPLFLHPTRVRDSDRLQRFGLEYVAAWMLDTSIAALDLVMSGIFARHPRLIVVHPHLGGTVPFLAGRIDHEYRKPWAMGSELDRPPTEYLKRFYTDTVSQNPGALALARRFYAPDRMLFSSDAPYWSMTEELSFVREHLLPAELPAVLGGNAQRVLNVRVDLT